MSSSNASNAARDLTVGEACARLNISPPTLYRMLAKGQIDSYLIGQRGRRITAESIEKIRHPK